VLGLPVLSWCAIAALLLVGYFLRYSRTGRALYTAGGNATAAYYTGINAGKMQFVSFCLSGRWPGSAAICGFRASRWRMSMWPTVLNCRWWRPV
jgi:rhamnose transport system permease protein